MKLVELNDLIYGVFSSMTLVKSTYPVDAYLAWDNLQVKYPSLAYALVAAETDGNIDTYTYRFYCGDRLTDAKTNYILNYGEEMAIIEKGLNAISNSDGILDVEFPRRYQFARQKFSDVLSVAYVDAQIHVQSEIGEC